MANAKLDYKKEYKDLYMPKTKPSIVEVPAIRFIMVDGKGNPNDEGGEYQQAVELLYALTYTIKMSKWVPASRTVTLNMLFRHWRGSGG